MAAAITMSTRPASRSFPCLLLPFCGPWAAIRLGVDWHEVWSRDYWREYLGALGAVGWGIQKLCAVIPHKAFTFSRLHARRLVALGRDPAILTGEFAGAAMPAQPATQPLTFVYAGRIIPEKRVILLIEAFAQVRNVRPDLRLKLFGQGPQRESVARLIARRGLEKSAVLSGFVAQEELDAAMSGALAIVQPSMREGYGMVVVEASARGVPAVVVEAEDNAAVELIEPGVNGEIAQATAPGLAEAMLKVAADAYGYRERTERWYAANEKRLSIGTSLGIIRAQIAGR